MAANEQIAASPVGNSLLKIARVGWYFCAAVSFGILLLSAADDFDTLWVLMPRNLPVLIRTKLVADLVIGPFVAFISLVLSGVLFFKRPHDGLVLLTAFFLLANGMAITDVNALGPYWPGAQRFTYSLIQPIFFGPLLIAFLSVFPNGRFTPAWTRWLVIVTILYAPASTLLFNTQDYTRPTTVYILAVLFWFVLIFAGFYAQIHRFRRVSNTIERQQTKWLLFGFSVAAVLAFLVSVVTVGSNYFYYAFPSRWATIVYLGWPLFYAAFPVSLTLAVLRYHLFDIDIIINRTLLYGALTTIVIVIYILVVGALGTLFQARGNLVIGLLATGLIAVLFEPLRERIQRAINRLFYGRRDDPLIALSQLGKRLEATIEPEVVLPTLVETIAETLKLPYVAISLRGSDELKIVAQVGEETVDTLEWPLIYQGEIIGQLTISVRGSGKPFNQMDKQLLENIAHQAGPAAYAVHLTQQLRESRARMVTAREEERRRLRRDLHDGLGPVLASQGLKMAAASHFLPDRPAKAQRLLEELTAQNEATVTEIRRLVYALRPATLDDLGLVAAVRDYATGIKVGARHSTQLKVDVQTPTGDLPSLPAAIEVAAYRISTEGLTNINRHAQAHHAVVSFALDTGRHTRNLNLEIMDDGIGLKENQRSGVGLISMYERAEEVGGKLFIVSSPGNGTRIIADLPLVY